MKYFLAFGGFFLAYFMIRYRESIGNSFGEFAWMKKIGGIYAIVVCIAVFIIFWSLATITGTEDALFAPIFWMFPFLSGETQDIVQPEFFYD